MKIEWSQVKDLEPMVGVFHPSSGPVSDPSQGHRDQGSVLSSPVAVFVSGYWMLNLSAATPAKKARMSVLSDEDEDEGEDEQAKTLASVHFIRRT